MGRPVHPCKRPSLQPTRILAIHIIDEAHSTEEARQLYWKLHPPKGLMKLIPLGMRTPPGNMDGLAAVILVQRYLSSKK